MIASLMSSRCLHLVMSCLRSLGRGSQGPCVLIAVDAGMRAHGGVAGTMTRHMSREHREAKSLWPAQHQHI